MTCVTQTILVATVVSLLSVTPGVADPGRGNGQGVTSDHQDAFGNSRLFQAQANRAANCPPGLAKKNPPCIPPGQVNKSNVQYGNRVGDVFRVGDYIIISDPRRYDLEQRQGWDYFRDDNRIYRVDSTTRQILAVVNLIDAFTN